MPTIDERRATFRDLHRDGCFIIPNPWDVGSARYLAHIGFKALATTSAGMAHALGMADNKVPLDATLAHIASIVEATDLPVNADFGNTHGDDPDAVAANVRRCVETGVAGLSIEDSTGAGGDQPLFPIDVAVARVEAARRAIDATGTDVLLTARAENFFAGQRDLDDSLRRLAAYKDAGADVLYAPGIRGDQIDAVVAAAAPLPVNVLALTGVGMTMDELTKLGVRRVSVGSHLSRAAWSSFGVAAARLFDGDIDALAPDAPPPNLNEIFG